MLEEVSLAEHLCVATVQDFTRIQTVSRIEEKTFPEHFTPTHRYSSH